MKALISIIFFVATFQLTLAQDKISILGDSYSTFYGYVTPKNNKCFYRAKSKFPNDVHDVNNTWWWILSKELGYTLDVNNSYSGSTICNTGYGHNDYSDRSFITRMDNLGNPDILFIFGGTNDCWARVPLGDYKYSDWTKKDLYKFRPAFCYLLHYLKQRNPKMRIINICNSDLEGNYNSSMEEICKHYNVENIQLQNIDKQFNHPSILGMTQIVTQLKSKIPKKNYKQNQCNNTSQDSLK